MGRRNPFPLVTAPVPVSKRLIIAFLLFIAVAAMIIVAWPATQAPAAAVVDVSVDGPHGEIWNDTVTAAPGTALQALLNASIQGGFKVETQGPIGNRYVSSVAGFDESNGGGWCIQVDRQDGNGLQDSPVSGDAVPLQTGWSVRWYWTSGQCDRY